MKRYLIFTRRGKPIGAMLYSEQTERDACRRLLLRKVKRTKYSAIYEVLGLRQTENQSNISQENRACSH